MSDLEQRLTDALRDGAQGAPAATGLAAAARSRARTRRRTRLVGAVAVVVLAVGVPTAVVSSGGSDDRDASRVATDPEAADPVVPDGFHYESWRDVTVLVPDSWRYGTLDQWCVGDEPERPIVERPGGVSTLVGCGPNAFGHGVRFQTVDNTDDFEWPLVQQTGDTWAPGTYVGARGRGGVLVEVALPDSALAAQILASVQVNARVDPNGCPVDSSSDPVAPGDSMTVCRYDASGQLEQSELLSGADLESAEEVLREVALERGGMSCATDAPVFQTVRLASVAENATVVLTDSCAELVVHGDVKALTSDVLYWALSPGWSGTVPDGVSLPSELRSP
jgi:hypothetical protein